MNGCTEPNDDGFDAWFEDSAACDAAGNPLLLYHGTSEDFSEFRGATHPIPKRGETLNWTGEQQIIFFTSDRRVARTYGKRVVAVNLSLRNPLIIEGNGAHWGETIIPSAYVAQAVQAGRDGVIVKDVVDVGSGKRIKADTYIAFDSEQIWIHSPEVGMKNENLLDRLAQGAGTKHWADLVSACREGRTFQIDLMGSAFHNENPGKMLQTLADATTSEDLVVIWDGSARPHIGQLSSFSTIMQQRHHAQREKVERAATSSDGPSEAVRERFRSVPTSKMKQ